MHYRMIAYSVGRILVAVAATMLAPLGLSLLYGESIALAYVIPIVISVLIGLCVSAKAPKNKSLYGRDGMFIVAIGWIVISIIGCLPFYISGQIPSFVDSFFETVCIWILLLNESVICCQRKRSVKNNLWLI